MRPQQQGAKPDIIAAHLAAHIAVAGIVHGHGRALAEAVEAGGAAIGLPHPAHVATGVALEQENGAARRRGQQGSSLLAVVVSERPRKTARDVGIAGLVHGNAAGQHVGGSLQLGNAQHLAAGVHLGYVEAWSWLGAAELRAPQLQRAREATRDVGVAIGAGGNVHYSVQITDGKYVVPGGRLRVGAQANEQKQGKE